tara:strand:+ start:317 stop:559 length:243 start_codon:yes stop_codon:yes gene_type:complete
MKFSEMWRLKWEKNLWNPNDGAEVGTYSKEYLENSLAELLALQKTTDKKIRVIKQQLALKEQERERRYYGWDYPDYKEEK